MKMINYNSSEYTVFYDGTSTANASGFDETTAPNGNLASMMRNWVIVTHPSIGTQERDKEISVKAEIQPK